MNSRDPISGAVHRLLSVLSVMMALLVQLVAVGEVFLVPTMYLYSFNQDDAQTRWRRQKYYCCRARVAWRVANKPSTDAE